MNPDWSASSNGWSFCLFPALPHALEDLLEFWGQRIVAVENELSWPLIQESLIRDYKGRLPMEPELGTAGSQWSG